MQWILMRIGIASCVAGMLHASGLVLASSTAQSVAPADAAAASKPGCATPEHHQFDFWVGRWDVFDAKTHARAGSSVIESVYGGCTLRENWSEPGFTGGSLNTYDATDRQWHQTWTDSSGAWREFVGGMQGERMVLVWRHPSVKDAGKIVHVRMTFSRDADGSVRQYSDQSLDGTQWIERYDYTYRPAKP
ncbi:MAG TPA: hypothetical protein VLR71_16520 [Casimicrobiaceae bacterium]|nr:hypothetical protein [Casimicrobiaceae bacterium]